MIGGGGGGGGGFFLAGEDLGSVRPFTSRMHFFFFFWSGGGWRLARAH